MLKLFLIYILEIFILFKFGNSYFKYVKCHTKGTLSFISNIKNLKTLLKWFLGGLKKTLEYNGESWREEWKLRGEFSGFIYIKIIHSPLFLLATIKSTEVVKFKEK